MRRSSFSRHRWRIRNLTFPVDRLTMFSYMDVIRVSYVCRTAVKLLAFIPLICNGAHSKCTARRLEITKVTLPVDSSTRLESFGINRLTIQSEGT